MARAPIGLKIRNRRKEIGLTQANLANRLGISASYLNLIEHDKRAISGRLLKQVSEELDIDMGNLDGAAERRLILDLHELAADGLFSNFNLTQAAASFLVGQHTDWARALVMLYRTYLDQEQTITALSDRLTHDPFLGEAILKVLTNVAAIRSTAEILDSIDDLSEDELGRFHGNLVSESRKLSEVVGSLSTFFDKANAKTRSLTPAEEVDDFIMEKGGYFPRLEDAACGLRRNVQGKGVFSESALVDYLERRHGVTVRLGEGGVRGAGISHNQCIFNPDARTLEVPAFASAATRMYEITWLLAELTLASAIDEEIKEADHLSSESAHHRAARDLMEYLVNSLLLPYDRFLEDALEARYDIDLLVRKYTVGFESVSHRLVTLRKPGSEGIPFALLQINPAGYVIKRFNLPHLPIPRYGSACPLWSIYTCFQTPSQIVRQLAAFPNGDRFLFFARAEAREQSKYSQTRVMRSIMLACNALHADKTVYADGLDFSSEALAEPVGLSCRLCSREDCIHREEDAIMGEEHQPLRRV